MGGVSSEDELTPGVSGQALFAIPRARLGYSPPIRASPWTFTRTAKPMNDSLNKIHLSWIEVQLSGTISIPHLHVEKKPTRQIQEILHVASAAKASYAVQDTDTYTSVGNAAGQFTLIRWTKRRRVADTLKPESDKKSQKSALAPSNKRCCKKYTRASGMFSR